MKKNRKKLTQKAFTLIELLAVIVILAIIALIATPIILNILSKTRKSAFEDSVYGIIKSTEAFYAEKILDNEEMSAQLFSFEPNIENSLSYSGEKPKGGFISVNDMGEIALAIHNGEWCALKDTNEKNVRLIEYKEGKCILEDIPITVKSNNPVNLILGTDRSVLEYFNIPNASVTCTDTSSKNTITSTKSFELGTHIIECSAIKDGEITSSAQKTIIIEEEIKIEDIIENNDAGENGTVADDEVGNKRLTGVDPNNYVLFNNELWRIIGIFDGQMKIVKAESIGKKAWNTIETNNWTTSSLQQELNGSYLDSIESTSKSYIDTTHLWHLGGETTAKITRAKMYESERGTATYGSNPETWNGAIGLIYPSDYAYATDSTNSACDSTIIFEWNDECKKNSWLLMNDAEQWTITPDSKEARYAYTINATGSIRISTDTGIVTLLHEVRPVLYLKSNIRITNADLDNAGSKEKPFLLSMS